MKKAVSMVEKKDVELVVYSVEKSADEKVVMTV